MKVIKTIAKCLSILSVVALVACDEDSSVAQQSKQTVESSKASTEGIYSKPRDTGATDLMRNMNGTPESIRSLLESGIDVNARDNSGGNALHYISAYTDPEIVRMLITAGINVNAKDEFNQIPLIKLCDKEKRINIKILELLIKAGSNINSKDFIGKSALNYLIEHKNIDAIKLLIANGANVNFERMGETLLHEAVLVGDVPIINLLIANGANVNAYSSIVQTPLMLAIKNDANADVIIALLRNKADPNLFVDVTSSATHDRKAEQYKPQNLLEFAIRYKRDENIIKALLQYGAKVTNKAVQEAEYLRGTQVYWEMRDTLN